MTINKSKMKVFMLLHHTRHNFQLIQSSTPVSKFTLDENSYWDPNSTFSIFPNITRHNKIWFSSFKSISHIIFTTHITNNKYQKGKYKLGKRKGESEENKVVIKVGSSSRNVIDHCVVFVLTALLPPKFPRIRSLGN